MRTLGLVALATLAFLASGCDTPTSVTTSTSAATAAADYETPNSTLPLCTSPDVALSIGVDKTTYEPGATARFAVTATSRAAHDCALRLPDCRGWSRVYLLDAADRIWWSSEVLVRHCPYIVRSDLRLRAGQSATEVTTTTITVCPASADCSLPGFPTGAYILGAGLASGGGVVATGAQVVISGADGGATPAGPGSTSSG